MCLRILLGNHQWVCINKLLKSLYPTAQAVSDNMNKQRRNFLSPQGQISPQKLQYLLSKGLGDLKIESDFNCSYLPLLYCFDKKDQVLKIHKHGCAKLQHRSSYKKSLDTRHWCYAGRICPLKDKKALRHSVFLYFFRKKSFPQTSIR